MRGKDVYFIVLDPHGVHHAMIARLRTKATIKTLSSLYGHPRESAILTPQVGSKGSAQNTKLRHVTMVTMLDLRAVIPIMLGGPRRHEPGLNLHFDELLWQPAVGSLHIYLPLQLPPL